MQCLQLTEEICWMAAFRDEAARQPGEANVKLKRLAPSMDKMVLHIECPSKAAAIGIRFK
jgi:hypothetical protein